MNILLKNTLIIHAHGLDVEGRFDSELRRMGSTEYLLVFGTEGDGK
jgi:hypothetical protein